MMIVKWGDIMAVKMVGMRDVVAAVLVLYLELPPQ
jgi:hypothetical protein